MDIYTSNMPIEELDTDFFLLTKNIEVGYNVSYYLWHLKEGKKPILHLFILVIMLWLLGINSTFLYGLFQPAEKSQLLPLLINLIEGIQMMLST